MNIYVGSLQYSPVFKSHCCAFGRACERKGYSVKYLFSYEYDWMLPKDVKERTTFVGHSTNIPSMLASAVSSKSLERIRKIFLEDEPTHIYLHNYHLLNHCIARLSKMRNCSFIYHVQEPYVQNKSAHGGFHQYWLYFFEYFQGKLLKNTNTAVVSSNVASRLFDFRYPNFHGRKTLIPLMYEDLAKNLDCDSQERIYVTFVGPPVPAKNPEKFMEIIRFSNENELGLEFLLISRGRIGDPKYFQEKNLRVFSKSRISDEEYGELIKRSIAVITPYRRETQSSVVLVSYMYGTPVVSSNIGGLPESVSHKKTGYLIDADAKVEEWIEGISYIQKHFPRLSEKCREYFVEKSSGNNWEAYLKDLLG